MESGDSYHGEVEVEGNDFHLFVERLVLRKETISFHFTGRDDNGKFQVVDTATKRSNDMWVAPDAVVTYQPNGEPSHALFEFSAVREGSDECLVNGSWKQTGNHWKFSGTIDRWP